MLACESLDVISRSKKIRFKTILENSKTVIEEWICRGREFQLLGEDTQKARDAKEHLGQEVLSIMYCL